MTFQFRPGSRENVGLLMGLAGGTGAGKTMSAMRLAAGISGSKPFAVIDTESRRALHYADRFRFDHGDLKPPFRPSAYEEAILAADKAGYPVIVVDSASHEHSGDGGLLEWHEAELQRMAGDDYKRREACNMAAWIKPKGEHKRFVSKLLQVRAHLILCFRAEEKVEMVKGDDGKMKIAPKKSRAGLDGWCPISEKNLPFEMTCSFLLLADRPGVPRPIKLQEQHRPIFPDGQPITEETGARLAEWARGGSAPAREATTTTSTARAKLTVQQLIDQASIAPHLDALDTFIGQNAQAIDWLAANRPETHKRVMDAIDQRRAELGSAELDLGTTGVPE
jgi:hypothetical protein